MYGRESLARREQLNPSPDVVAEIDRLAAVSRAAPQDTASSEAMWRAAFGLDRWLFIARGEMSAPRPSAIGFPQRSRVLAFSTAERAQAAERANGLSDEDVTHILAIPLPDAIEWAASLSSSGAFGMAFDTA